jgi:prevent-host-death family protein
MAVVTTKEARDQFAELVNRAAYGKERVVVTRRGKGVAALVPMEALEDLALLEELENEIDLTDARKAFAEAKKLGTTPWSAIKSDLGL